MAKRRMVQQIEALHRQRTANNSSGPGSAACHMKVPSEGKGGGRKGIDSLLVGGERESRRKKGVWGPLRAGEREGGGCGWGGVGPRRGVSFRFATPLSR
ncbi:hypothetical protein C4D60_Mb00t07300 [Musa balbisiana]|uniref:Uncharacterized protein n=1 Tax=Musa balbisiana TaxID=52838 RepID=A0A4S8I508_MUSBA|nr:hypothetical protein C4D60_Mb00t07300 [Musa balbisiana]